MFQLIGAARTLNTYGAHTKIYEEKKHQAIHKLRVFREEHQVNYLDSDDKEYATECRLVEKLKKIELKRDLTSQSTSIGLANAALKSVLPGPVGNMCDVVSSFTRSYIQTGEAKAGAIGAIQAVAQKEAQRAALREASSMAADVVGTAATTMALPATVATGVIVATGAAVFSADARSTMWNGLTNAVTGSLALTRDWKDRLFGTQHIHKQLIDFHAAIDEARKKLFDKKEDFKLAKSSLAATQTRWQDMEDQRHEVERRIANRQTSWFSRFVFVISTSEYALLAFTASVLCYLFSAFKREHQWYFSQSTQLKTLNNELSRASNEFSRLHTRVSQLSNSINKRVCHISSLEKEFLQTLHTPHEF